MGGDLVAAAAGAIKPAPVPPEVQSAAVTKAALNSSVSGWRKQHNFFLDSGMKFNIAHKSPMITGTDLFDLEKFGCHQSRGWQGIKLFRKKDSFKHWWRHPAFTFGAKFQTIGVRLEDLTTGELRWDAIYSIGQAPHRRGEGVAAQCPDSQGDFLCPEEMPIGGSKPFFQPDWCPAPGDFLAHKYKLTIKNLSQKERPEQPLVGELFFTQYGPSQLANTYAFENSATLEGS